MKKLDDLVPAGLSARREIGWVLAAYALAGLWSLTFLVRYFGRRENLFIVKAGRRVLQAGARMEPFLEVLDGALLGFAATALLMAGLDGIRRKLDPKDHNWGPFDCNLFDLPKEQLASLGCLPASLPEALKALEEDHEYLLQGDVFSELLIKQWIDKKRKDAALVEQSPHPREFEQYYDL